MSIDLKELANLLKACKATNVSELKVGNVVVKFSCHEKQKNPRKVTDITVPTPEQLKEAQTSAVVQENLESAEDELAHMLIENPALYEQLLVERELTDSESGQAASFN